MSLLSTRWISTGTGLSGSIAMTRMRAFFPSCGARRIPANFIVVVANFTPVLREDYRVGVPEPGFYREIMNTDAEKYGGTNVGNLGGVHAEADSLGQPSVFHQPALAAPRSHLLQTRTLVVVFRGASNSK